MPYAALHKIGCVNWTPTQCASALVLQQAQFLYLVGKGLPIDLGSVIYSYILKHAESPTPGSYLCFPFLNSGLLQRAGMAAASADTIDTPGPVLHCSTKLRHSAQRAAARAAEGPLPSCSVPPVPDSLPHEVPAIVKFFMGYVQSLQASLEAVRRLGDRILKAHSLSKKGEQSQKKKKKRCSKKKQGKGKGNGKALVDEDETEEEDDYEEESD